MSLNWRSDQKFISKMAQHTLDSGWEILNMVMVSKFGKTVPSMKETGGSTKHVGMENSGMLTVMSSKENG